MTMQSTNCETAETSTYYERLYSEQGFSAQRRYPNEELCRFMGRNFFHIHPTSRAAVKILETGCGSGANLWMLAREGFDAYGIDLSSVSIELAREMLANYGCSAQLKIGDMSVLDYTSNSFAAVVDVFSSNCFDRLMGLRYLQSVRRVLEPGGLFFSYFPAKSSEAFIRHEPAEMIDEDTLTGIYREDSPFVGNHYPFRFMHPEEYQTLLEATGFEVQYCETVSRTYGCGRESFSFVTIEGRKL